VLLNSLLDRIELARHTGRAEERERGLLILVRKIFPIGAPADRLAVVGATALSTDEHRAILARLDHLRCCRLRTRLQRPPPPKLVLELARALNDQTQLPLADNRCEVAHDSGAAADRDRLADLKPLLRG
jgi:hypothetical protein